MSRTITISSCSAAKVTSRWRAGSSCSPEKSSSYMDGHTLGGRHQAVALGVLPDGDQDLGHGRPHPFDVDAHASAPL